MPRDPPACDSAVGSAERHRIGRRATGCQASGQFRIGEAPSVGPPTTRRFTFRLRAGACRSDLRLHHLDSHAHSTVGGPAVPQPAIEKPLTASARQTSGEVHRKGQGEHVATTEPAGPVLFAAEHQHPREAPGNSKAPSGSDPSTVVGPGPGGDLSGSWVPVSVCIDEDTPGLEDHTRVRRFCKTHGIPTRRPRKQRLEIHLDSFQRVLKEIKKSAEKHFDSVAGEPQSCQAVRAGPRTEIPCRVAPY
jgi:hypothetical protein